MRADARTTALILSLALLGAAGAARGQVGPVKLESGIQAKLGVTLAPLAADRRAVSVAGFAKVLDPGPLAQLDSDIDTAEAAAAASHAEAERSRTLNAADQAVSAKALEAAQSQARADAARLALLRRRLGLEWGEGIARLSTRARSALVGEIADGRSALVRIDTASGEGQAALKSVEIDLGPLGIVHAAVLGPARAADTRLLSPGLIAKAVGPGARLLASGLSVPVRLSAAAPVSGVVIPRSALLRQDGRTWVYVRQGPETFLRRAVESAQSSPAGLFVPGGFRPGEIVVVQGASALFAAESAPPAGAKPAGDKDD